MIKKSNLILFKIVVMCLLLWLSVERKTKIIIQIIEKLYQETTNPMNFQNLASINIM